MNQITALTSEATEHTLNKSDTQQPTMSLGGGAPMQEVKGTGVKNNTGGGGLDPDIKSVKDAGAIDKSLGSGGTMPNKPKEETQKEIKEDKEQLTETQKEMTQGEQAQRVDDINRAIEQWNEYINNGSYNWHDFMTSLTTKEAEMFKDYLINNNLDNLGKLDFNNKATRKDFIGGFLSHLLGNYKNELHGIKTDQGYDNRTDEQIRNDKLLEEQRARDDNAHQRMVDDMRAAGLNPAAFKGANYGGGGGGGSGSRDEDEEEKRKRRRRERFEQERARKAEKMRQMELVTGIVTNLMGTATKGIGAGAYIANQNKLAQASQAHQTQENALKRQDAWRLRQEQRDHELNRLADIETMKYDEDLERWLRQKTGKSRR